MRPNRVGSLLTISQVERDTGLSKDTLRIWERRYGFPNPGRDAQGERQISSEGDADDASFSPDGRWIAYRSNESGRGEIYIRPFVASGSSGPSLGEGKWQVSRDGSTASTAKWRNDGKVYLSDVNRRSPYNTRLYSGLPPGPRGAR